MYTYIYINYIFGLNMNTNCHTPPKEVFYPPPSTSSSPLLVQTFLKRFCLQDPPPPRGGYSKKFYTGRLRPEVQSLTLLYTIFFRKGTPFVYLLLEKGTLSYTFLRRLMNKSLKQEVFLSFFSRSA